MDASTPQQDSSGSSYEAEGHGPSKGPLTGCEGTPVSPGASCSSPSPALASLQKLGDQQQQSHRSHTRRRLQQWSNSEGTSSVAASLAGCSDTTGTHDAVVTRLYGHSALFHVFKCNAPECMLLLLHAVPACTHRG